MQHILVLLLLLIAVPVWAGGEGTVQTPGGAPIIVWKSKDDMSKGMDLVRAKVHETNPPLVFQHVACMVPSGTKVVSHGFGLLTREITVTETKWSGCHGIIANEFFKFN